MTAQTEDLIKRLEAAEAGSRELDGRLADALAQAPNGSFRMTDFDAVWGTGAYTRWVAPHYTTSLDAALALAERVLPGQARAMGDMAFDPHGKPWAVVWTKGGDPKFTAESPTPRWPCASPSSAPVPPSTQGAGKDEPPHLWV